jgi:hypothetical protein
MSRFPRLSSIAPENQPANFWDAMLNHFYLARYAIALILAVAI